jgi:hypothetical protein
VRGVTRRFSHRATALSHPELRKVVGEAGGACAAIRLCIASMICFAISRSWPYVAGRSRIWKL